MVKKDEEELLDIQHTTLLGNRGKDQEYDGDSYDHVVYVVSDDCTQCIRLVWIAFIIVGFEHNKPY